MLKQIFFCYSCIIFITTQLYSQNYVPLAVEGAHWVIRYDNINTPMPVDGLWEYYMQGDTSINSINYKKTFKRLLVISQEGPPFEPAGVYELYGFIRDDIIDKKVYAIQMIDQGNCPINEEYLLYDFSIGIGDTAVFCLIPDFINYTLTSITPGIFLGFETRVFSLFSNNDESDYFEGMGSYFGLFEEMFAPFKSADNLYIYHTYLYYYCRESPCDLFVSLPENIDHEILFHISPNPASQVLHFEIKSDMRVEEIILVNIHGQIVIRNLIEQRNINSEMNISSLAPGLYNVSLIGENKMLLSRKIIITK